MTGTHAAVDRAARDSYGRLLAFLSTRSRDVASAEDALSDAFQAALETWPASGIPERPEAWLLTTARRKLIDRARQEQVQAEALPSLAQAAHQAQVLAEGADGFPDERLTMLLLCAHPAIDVLARTPLMLQTVLGLDAARIASAFLVRPATMGQRLARAKARIRDDRIRFEVPESDQVAPRLDAVLEAIYAAYGSGWDDVSGASERTKGLAGEAIHLGRVVVRLLPGHAESKGLLALMLHCDARRSARRADDGSYVPLSAQPVTRWSVPLIAEAELMLADAAHLRQTGRFQLEAAIQSIHAQRALTGSTDWQAVALMYEGLVRLAPTIGALVGRAAALAEVRGADAGLALLQELPSEAVSTYQPYWALSGHLLRRLGRTAAADHALNRAIGLSDDPAVRAYLATQIHDGSNGER